MSEWLKSILSSPVMKARAQKLLTGASLAAGGWVMSHMLDWLNAHAAFISHADALAIAGTVASFVGGIILTVGGALYDQLDVSKVNAKIVTAAATGSVDLANDPAARKTITAASGSPEALNQAVAVLKAGQE